MTCHELLRLRGERFSFGLEVRRLGLGQECSHPIEHRIVAPRGQVDDRVVSGTDPRRRNQDRDRSDRGETSEERDHCANLLGPRQLNVARPVGEPGVAPGDAREIQFHELCCPPRFERGRGTSRVVGGDRNQRQSDRYRVSGAANLAGQLHRLPSAAPRRPDRHQHAPFGLEAHDGWIERAQLLDYPIDDLAFVVLDCADCEREQARDELRGGQWWFRRSCGFGRSAACAVSCAAAIVLSRVALRLGGSSDSVVLAHRLTVPTRSDTQRAWQSRVRPGGW